MNEKWILPLSIDSDPLYVQNLWKGRNKALLHIHLFNDFSGEYVANAMNIYLGDNNNDPATVSSRELRVVDEKVSFSMLELGGRKMKIVTNIKYLLPLVKVHQMKKVL